MIYWSALLRACLYYQRGGSKRGAAPEIDRGALSPDERKLLSLLGDLMLAWEGNRYDLL